MVVVKYWIFTWDYGGIQHGHGNNVAYLLVGLRLGCLLGTIETVVLMRIPLDEPRVVFEGTSMFFRGPQ